MTEFLEASRQYRRGVVLGLSLAELFTVLVFLLLLVLGAYLLIQDQVLDRRDSLVKDQRDVLITLIDANGAAIEPALPGDLIRPESLDAVVRMGNENRRLRDQLMERNQDVGDVVIPSRSENYVPEEEFRRQQKAIDALTHELATMEKEIRQLTDPASTISIAQFQEQVGKLKQENNALASELDESVKRQGELESENQGLQREIRTTMEALDDLRGQDSPCWFSMATRENGEPYERATYLFDVLIGNDSIFVQDIPAESPEHRKQKNELPFDRGALNRHLTDDEFLRAFRQLKYAGENRQVRLDRRCTFYVAVWDATGDTNKPRYKQAHLQTVQQVFNTYEYVHESWPH